MGSLRTKDTQAAYDAARAQKGYATGCRLCEAPAMQEFTHWKIITDEFPYDKIAKVHDMIVPKEHLTAEQLPIEAWVEFEELKRSVINDRYELVASTTYKNSSNPRHFHMHLIVIKDDL